LIPQRNISLLSNRLAAAGGLRIREDVLERDYCLAWFLNALAESDLRPVLAFKGGTALKRCYFADYRFSEDVDFTLRQTLPFEEIRTRLEPVYAAVAQESGIVFAFDRQDPRVRTNTHEQQNGGPLSSDDLSFDAANVPQCSNQQLTGERKD
jgi:predicted nucleotidyltransferase component of viral defense system